MLNWDDYNVAEGEAPVAAPQQQAPVQPEVVNKALETLNEQPAVVAPATDSVKAAAEAAREKRSKHDSEVERAGPRGLPTPFTFQPWAFIR